MDVLKLVDYPNSDSDDEARNPEATPTPITFRGKRVFRRIIQSGTKSSIVTRSTARERQIKNKLANETPIKKRNVKEGSSSRAKLLLRTLSKTPTPLKTPKRTPKGTPRGTPMTPISSNSEHEIETPKKKRWNKDESHRLKMALKAAVNPTTDEHWELICRSLGGTHTIEECKEQAIKLDWKPTTSSENGAKKKAEEEIVQQRLLTNSPWRRAVEMRKSRRSVDCSNKYFEQNVNDLTLTDLNLDDSLFTAAFKTPPEQPKCARRPFLIRVVAEEDEDESSSED